MIRLRLAFATVASASLAFPLAAQSACDFDPRSVGYALSSIAVLIQRHDMATTEAERLKAATEIIGELNSNPKRFRNEPVRNFMLGQVYVRWYMDQGPAPKLRVRRAEMGFKEFPDGDFWITDAMDSAMSVVEREKPLCSDSTAKYRNALFASVLNTAIANYNGKGYDAALEYASRGLQVSPRSPQLLTSFQVISKASTQAGNLPLAVSSLEALLTRLDTGTAGVPTRAAATFTLAGLLRDQATKLDGAARTDGLRKAAGLFKATVDLAPNGPNAVAAQQAYARAVKDAGDAGAVAGVYADMMANPGKYTALQLFEAGVQSVNAAKLDDAATLYEAGLQQNAGYRDALFNLANVYFALHQADKMAPVVGKLRVIDPLNPDVLKLAGAVWQERGRRVTDAGAKKSAQDSVAAYLDRAAKLPARVRVTQFTVGADNTAILKGTIENLGAASTNFTVAFELLDKAGASVATANIGFEGVAAKSVREFNVQMNGAAPAAWRYSLR